MAVQCTLATSASFVGAGLHGGRRVRVTLRPAAEDTGIVFRRLDLDPSVSDIALHPDAVTSARLATTVSNANGASVATVEHLLAALAGLGVDNVLIEIDGDEAPAMDGSALTFARTTLQGPCRHNHRVTRLQAFAFTTGCGLA